MASTFAVTRNHLIFGLCLPLAVLLGYLLAEPYASVTITMLVILFIMLFVPVMMRWYHALLIFSWHLAMQPTFLPGRLQVWVVMAFAAAFFAILNRSVDPDFRMTNVPMLTKPMVGLAVVVIATAFATGGIGFNVFGSRGVGGKNYLMIFGAIVGYFSLSMRPIKSQHAAWAIAAFFLAGLSSLIPWLAGFIGPTASFVSIFFTDWSAPNQSIADQTIDTGMHRLTGFMPAAVALFCWLIARHGATGILDLTRPWRLVLLLGSVLMGCLGGFRSMLLLMSATFLVMVCLERMWRTRAFLTLVVGATLSAVCLLAFAKKLPFPVQRAISFLPVEIDPLARLGAEWSTEWRIEMWKSVSTQIPQYLLLGKGYTLSGSELALVMESTTRGYMENWAASAMAGDYHNGPLSVILPFGIWGVIAVGWLFYAGTRYLYKVYQDGPEHLKAINRFLLALFMARILFFLFVYGSLYGELFHYTGILGLSVALNINTARSAETDPTPHGSEFDDAPK